MSAASSEPIIWLRGKLTLLESSLDARIDLIDAAKGNVIWNETFAASGATLFDLQQEIASKIANRLVRRIDDARLTRSSAKPTTSLAAYELLQRGLVRLRGYRDEDNLAAKDLFEQALAKDPNYALAHSYLALADLILAGFGGAAPDVMAAVVERAYRAVNLAPEEPRCHRVF